MYESLSLFFQKRLHLTFFDIKLAQRFLLFECQIMTFFHSILNVLMDSESVNDSEFHSLKMPHPNAFRFKKSHTTAFLSIIKKDGI